MTVDDANDGIPIVAAPLVTVHKPLPVFTAGTLPAKVKFPTLQFVRGAPATETVAGL